MPVYRIYAEIGPGERIALSKLAVGFYEQHGRPLRLAIDISIWLFQVQSGKGSARISCMASKNRLHLSKGGTNPALRTFYYRLLRLISLSIHPLFVFDGPHKPPFKRNKRTGPNVASIPEFLAKQLLKQFGLPFHIAPGEAEADCALLQQKGIVDAVLSEDVDTLMFGSGLTMRNWSPEGSLKTKTFTHVNLYDSQKTRQGRSGLDREGMILVALMSGGDYLPEGIPGCGSKTACEAARAGFGKDLCRIGRKDHIEMAVWRERLQFELRTNESGFFKQKHKTLIIPEDFPKPDILKYYVQPMLSSEERVEHLRSSLKWDQDIDISALRNFTGDAFDWVCISGARKFIRNLAPALLVKELRLRADKQDSLPDDTFVTALQEAKLIRNIYSKRQHLSTDNTKELRIGYIPLDIVKLDLAAEEPDPELPIDRSDSEDETGAGTGTRGRGSGAEEPASPKRKRAPSTFDPANMEKIWVFETFVKVGVPLKMQDWEESFRDARKYEAMKATQKRSEKKTKKPLNGGMTDSVLDPFTKVTKPGVDCARPRPRSKTPDAVSKSQPTHSNGLVSAVEPFDAYSTNTRRPTPSKITSNSDFQAPLMLPDTPTLQSQPSIVCLLSSPHEIALPQKRPLQRTQSEDSPVSKSRKPVSVERIDPVQPASPRSDSLRGLRRTATFPPTHEECEQDGYDHNKKLPRSKRKSLFKSTSSSLPFRAVTSPPLAECGRNPCHRRIPQYSSKDATSHGPLPGPEYQDLASHEASANKVSKTSSAVITITSSPPTTPVSRRPASGQNQSASRQREITSWITVSPSSARRRILPESGHLNEHEKAPESPSPLRSLPRLTTHAANCQDAADVLCGEALRNLDDKGSRPVMQSKATAQVARRSPRLSKYGNPQSLRGKPIETNVRHLVKFRMPCGLDATASGRRGNEKQTAAGQIKKKVRLRESMPGAWEFIEESHEKPSKSRGGIKGTRGDEEDVLGCSAGTDTVANGSEVETGAKKRVRRVRDKQWRLSQVEVLDMSKWT